MTHPQTFADKISAADKSIGFDYQYYYFLYKLLNLKTGESIGLEVLDDVHMSVNASLQLLFQLKHTTSLAADGKPSNLTSLDGDLWKTMSNWTKTIIDLADDRGTKEKQLAFIKKTEFHLVTNKSNNSTNKFTNKIAELIDGQCEFSSVKQEVEALQQKTTSVEIKQYIMDVLALDSSVMEKFFGKLRFQLEENEITAKIRRSISEKAVHDDDIEDVFNRLDSNIREDNFINTKAGKPIYISYEDFMTKYRRIFISSRNQKLRYVNYVPVMPAKLLDQKFITHLLHIGDIEITELEIMAEYTRQKLRLAGSLVEWQRSGQLVGDEIAAFHDEVRLRWRNQFRNKFRTNAPPSDVLTIAIDLINSLRSEKFKLADEELNTELSNGELYNLSDISAIGWHPGWEQL